MLESVAHVKVALGKELRTFVEVPDAIIISEAKSHLNADVQVRCGLDVQ